MTCGYVTENVCRNGSIIMKNDDIMDLPPSLRDAVIPRERDPFRLRRRKIRKNSIAT